MWGPPPAGSDSMNGNNPDNILMWYLILFWSCSLQHIAVYLPVSFLISVSLHINSDCLISMQAPHLSCHCCVLEKMQEECFVSPMSRCDSSRWMDKILIKNDTNKTMFRQVGNLNSAFHVPHIGTGLSFYATCCVILSIKAFRGHNCHTLSVSVSTVSCGFCTSYLQPLMPMTCSNNHTFTWWNSLWTTS